MKILITILLLLFLSFSEIAFAEYDCRYYYKKYGWITKVEMLYLLDNIAPKVMIWRMSRFPKIGNVSVISLEEYNRLVFEGKLK